MELQEILDINGSGYPTNSEEFSFELFDLVADSDMSGINQTDSNLSSPSYTSDTEVPAQENPIYSNPITPLQSSDDEGSQSQDNLAQLPQMPPLSDQNDLNELGRLNCEQTDLLTILNHMSWSYLQIISNQNRLSTVPAEPWSPKKLREIVFSYENLTILKDNLLILVTDRNWVKGNAKPKQNNDPINCQYDAYLTLSINDSNGKDITNDDIYTINTTNYDRSIPLNNKNHGMFYIKLLKTPKDIHVEWYDINIHILSADGSYVQSDPIRLTNDHVISSRSRKRVADKIVKNDNKKQKQVD